MKGLRITRKSSLVLVWILLLSHLPISHSLQLLNLSNYWTSPAISLHLLFTFSSTSFQLISENLLSISTLLLLVLAVTLAVNIHSALSSHHVAVLAELLDWGSHLESSDGFLNSRLCNRHHQTRHKHCGPRDRHHLPSNSGSYEWEHAFWFKMVNFFSSISMAAD